MLGRFRSSRKVAARLWNGAVPSYLEPLQAAQCLWGAENFSAAATEERAYWAGSQVRDLPAFSPHLRLPWPSSALPPRSEPIGRARMCMISPHLRLRWPSSTFHGQA